MSDLVCLQLVCLLASAIISCLLKLMHCFHACQELLHHMPVFSVLSCCNGLSAAYANPAGLGAYSSQAPDPCSHGHAAPPHDPAVHGPSATPAAHDMNRTTARHLACRLVGSSGIILYPVGCMFLFIAGVGRHLTLSGFALDCMPRSLSIATGLAVHVSYTSELHCILRTPRPAKSEDTRRYQYCQGGCLC